MQCVKFIYAYLAFSCFLIFFFLTGGILIDLIHKAGIHLDAISCVLLLYNFAAVGSVGLFLMPAPLAMKQVCPAWLPPVCHRHLPQATNNPGALLLL